MKIGVVGIRGMGQSHIHAVRQSKVVTQVAGCDLNEALRREVEEKFKIPTFADVATLLDKFKPDAVLVVTAPNRHAEVTRACFERRIPVLTEKPIASSPEESAVLVRAAEQRKIPFQVGFELRYCGFMRAVQSVLAAGTLGKLSHIGHTQISGPHVEPGYMSRARTGGIFYEKLCHQVDLFRFMFGEPKRCIAIAAPNLIKTYEANDNILSAFEFENGCKGTIKFETRRAAQVDARSKPERIFEGHEAGHYCELVFSGNQGSAVYDAWNETVDVLRLNRPQDNRTELVRRIVIKDEFGKPSYDVETQDNDFFEHLAAGKAPRYPASDALKSMTWCEKAEESLRRGGEWIS